MASRPMLSDSERLKRQKPPLRKHKQFIAAAKKAVKKATVVVKTIVTKSAKMIKKDLANVKKAGKKVKIAVKVKFNCRCAPKVKALVKKVKAKKAAPKKKHSAPLKKKI